jgi:hypothetical protein
VSGARETAYQALFTLISGAYAWASPPSRQLSLWTEVPPSARPAFFQSETGRDGYVWSSTFLPKRSIEARLFIYTASQRGNPGAPQLNDISDAIDAAMAPSVGSDLAYGRQTLGGAVFQARIKEIPFRDPGDLDQDGLLIVTVEMILP